MMSDELRDDIRKMLENPNMPIEEYVGAMIARGIVDSPEWKAAEEADRQEMGALLYGNGRNAPRGVINTGRRKR